MNKKTRTMISRVIIVLLIVSMLAGIVVSFV